MGGPRLGRDWDDRLDEWATLVTAEGGPPEDIQHWSFPTDALRDEYLEHITDRSEEEVLSLLRLFLFEVVSFLHDQWWLDQYMARPTDGGLPRPKNEFERRLLVWLSGEGFPHPGVRWVLDLLPTYPRRAIDAVDAYLTASVLYLPDGRISGLADAAALIRARYIGVPRTTEGRRLALYELSNREFEVLVHRLYSEMGFDAELTPARRDGGRDIIATRQDLGHRETLRIECKLHVDPVGVDRARQLLGVVAHELANRGVLVSAGKFTRGARSLASADFRLELIDGGELVVLMNEHLGADWPARLDYVLSPVRGPV